MLGIEWYVIFFGVSIAILLAIALYLLGWLGWAVAVLIVSAVVSIFSVFWEWVWGQAKGVHDEHKEDD